MQFDPRLENSSSCVVEEEASNFGLRISDCGLGADTGSPISEIQNPMSSKLARPIRVMFMQTDMRVGGAEVVTANILRRIDRDRFVPELCCLKQRGALGEELANEIPVHHGLLSGKYDLRVWPRLTRLFVSRRIDAVVTVGAGDKMFWGRLAAWRAGVPVIVSALHSTGWPDRIGQLNRLLTPITDGFIAVAEAHGRFLVQEARFPERKVTVIRNGVDTDRFAPGHDVIAVRRELGLGETDPVVGIVAALRPEKNHELFLKVARRVVSRLPAARFLVVGEGPRRDDLERLSRETGLQSCVQFLGSRNDVPRILSAMDVFALTSHVEANPVSILEAMSIGRPVVATNVGSIHEAVSEGKTGFLVPPGNATKFSERILQLLHAPLLAHSMGASGRQAVLVHWSLNAMVAGYERLIESLYVRKMSVVRRPLSVAATCSAASLPYAAHDRELLSR
jgi:glycosyltransferase involved in cell wall biosynthesis